MDSKRITVLQINAANILSTGKIMLGIAEIARKNGIEMYTASKYTKAANKLEKERGNKWHFLIGYRVENTLARYFAWYTDFQDVGPVFGTRKLIKKIKKIQPDIIHLHDIVGWYIDIGLFFKFLKKYNKPIVWTMHCCWAYTGRCIYYDSCHCEQWKHGCKKCPQLNGYPYSKWLDQCDWNFRRKQKLFTGIQNLTIVTPSVWLKSEIKQSVLKDYNTKVINNGIDMQIFTPSSSGFREKYNIEDKKVVLCVASAWAKRKGLDDVFMLAEKLPQDYKVVVVGLNKQQIEMSPSNIIALERTKNVQELVEIYSMADVFVNTTYEDNYPTVNLEAQACGTPVITYNTGGSPESVNLSFGAIVDKGDLKSLVLEIQRICEKVYDSNYDIANLVDKARSNFSQEEKFREYAYLYKELYENQN